MLTFSAPSACTISGSASVVSINHGECPARNVAAIGIGVEDRPAGLTETGQQSKPALSRLLVESDPTAGPQERAAAGGELRAGEIEAKVEDGLGGITRRGGCRLCQQVFQRGGGQGGQRLVPVEHHPAQPQREAHHRAGV